MDLQRSALWPRPLAPHDRMALLDYIYTDPHTYYYPGWTSLQDWLTRGLGWGLVSQGALVGALVVVPETDTRAWLRLFVTRADVPRDLAWRLLMRAILPGLHQAGITHLTGIGGRSWVDRFFRQRGFRREADLRLLLWRGDTRFREASAWPPQVRPMRMTATDLDAAAQVDRAAFDPAWRLRPELVRCAFEQARLALVARARATDEVVAYALFTPAPQGAHLARLAVHPRWQGQGIGRALVRTGLQHLQRREPGLWVSVNTQADNQAALRLYAGLGFRPQAADVPVWTGRLPTMSAPLPQAAAPASAAP